MQDEKLVGFALRLPPKVKEAAAALVKVRSINRWKDGVTIRPLGCSSINEAINTLIREGMATVEAAIDADLQDYRQPELERWQMIMQFLMQHPAASHVLPENLPEGSAARAWLAEVIEQWAEDEPGTVVDRAWVTEEYGHAQRWVQELTAAKGAIQRACAPA